MFFDDYDDIFLNALFAEQFTNKFVYSTQVKQKTFYFQKKPKTIQFNSYFCAMKGVP